MSDVLHKNLAAGTWHTMSLSEQLGNVGSEIGRAANNLRMGNLERHDGALTRAFELMDLTLSDKRWQGLRLREIARLREVCADTFYGKGGEYGSTPESLEKYLYYFAVAARSGTRSF